MQRVEDIVGVFPEEQMIFLVHRFSNLEKWRNSVPDNHAARLIWHEAHRTMKRISGIIRSP